MAANATNSTLHPPPFSLPSQPLPSSPADLPPDTNVGPALLISSSILIGFVLLTTLTRLYVRAHNRVLGWDDHTIVLTASLALARFGCQVQQVRHGDGRHRVYLDPADYRISNMYGWYAQLFLFLGVCLLKISICLLLLRIKNDRKLRRLIYGVMAGLVVTNGIVVLILLAECRPIEGYWTGAISDGRCWDPRVRVYTVYFSIAYNILTDILCSFLPLFVVWKVRMPLKSKLLVCGLMSLGLIATGFGIGRAVSLTIITTDLTYVYCIAAIWANAEFFLGIIAANLALSRSIYVFFQGGPGPLHRPSPAEAARVHSSAESRRSAYLQAKLRGDHVQRLRTTIISAGRPATEEGSSDDEESGMRIPRSPGIQKKTEFWLSEEDLRALGRERGESSERST